MEEIASIHTPTYPRDQVVLQVAHGGGSLGARRAIRDAYQMIDRRPPTDLPVAVEYRERSCLDIDF
jgi:hypothetical protein